MSEVFNIYCDESCHLKHDGVDIMVLGAVWCPFDQTREISQRIREIKVKHHMHPDFEIKWTKVSPSKLSLYRDVIDYFFDDDDLHFRALIVDDKSRLRHEAFQQDHDKWYYKMYFDMLKVLLNPQSRYRIYIDMKDTRGVEKVANLRNVLCNNMYDFSREIIERAQLVRSHEVEQQQLADLLIGCICYANRHLSGNRAKLSLVQRVQQRSRYSLRNTTLYREPKVNLFRWTGKGAIE